MPDAVQLEWQDTQFLARLQDYVNVFPQDADVLVQKVARRVLGDIRTGWPVASGASRAGWIGPRKIAPLTYQLSNSARYAVVIEFGGYRGVGHKVVPAGGELLSGGIYVNRGLYARQRPAAPVRRALSKAYGQMTLELDKRLLRQISEGR